MLGILVVMFVLLMATKLPAWVVFLGSLTATMTLGLAPTTELLAGFSNAGVITVGVLFMVAAGMYSTGAITLISDKLIGLPHSLGQAYIRILPLIAIGSAFLNNTPLVAMTVPVIRDISRTARLAASKLYIPLSFSSILGGASTLIGTSTNLIIAGLILDKLASAEEIPAGLEEATIFFPTPIAAPAALVGIAFIMLTARWLLPDRKREVAEDIEKRLYGSEYSIEEGSYLIDQTIEEAGFAYPVGYELVSLRRTDDTQPGLDPDLILKTGDILSFTSDSDSLPALWSRIGLTPHTGGTDMDDERYKHRLVEVVVAPKSEISGHTISELPLRDPPPFEARVIALSRNGRPPEGSIHEFRVQGGDNSVLEVNDSFFYDARDETDFLITKRLRGYNIQRVDRAAAAIIITGAMVAAAAFGWLSMLNAALLATFLMLITGCMSIRAAGRSIEWDTVVVLACAVGLEAGVSNTGLSKVIAEGLAAIGGDNPYIALTAIYVGCIIMTNLITNAAAAAFMFPISIALAIDLGVSFLPFAAILMVGTSYAFIVPSGYQTNMMVQKPGRYEFLDYARLGLPVTIIAGIIVLILAPIVYGF
jgi:di/tricarboxylate transporter